MCVYRKTARSVWMWIYREERSKTMWMCVYNSENPGLYECVCIERWRGLCGCGCKGRTLKVCVDVCVLSRTSSLYEYVCIERR